jgi:hypothetical protein
MNAHQRRKLRRNNNRIVMFMKKCLNESIRKSETDGHFQSGWKIDPNNSHNILIPIPCIIPPMTYIEGTIILNDDKEKKS